MQIEISVEAKGPIWEKTTDRRVERFMGDVKFKIAREAFLKWTFLTHQFENPTDNYLSHLEWDRGAARDTIGVDGVDYDWWLEIGKETKRENSGEFEGYHLRRKTLEYTEGVAQQILDLEKTRLLAELGGR